MGYCFREYPFNSGVSTAKTKGMEMALGNTSLLVNSLFFLFFDGFGDKTALIYFAD